MKARGIVPVGVPVDTTGAATARLAEMVGIAGRENGFQVEYRNRQKFNLVTDKECLVQLVGPCDLRLDGTVHRLQASDRPYVTIRHGKIVKIHGAGR